MRRLQVPSQHGIPLRIPPEPCEGKRWGVTARENDNTGLVLKMCDLFGRAPLNQNTTRAPIAQRMDNILPDMGRMSARLLLEEKTGSSPAAIPAANAQPFFIRSST